MLLLLMLCWDGAFAFMMLLRCHLPCLSQPTSAGAACAGMGMRQGVYEQQPPNLPWQGLWGSEHHHAGGQHVAGWKPGGFVCEGPRWSWNHHLDQPSCLWHPHRSENRMGAWLCKQHIAEVSSQWNGDNHSCKQSFAAEHWDWGLKIAMLGVRKTVLNCVIPGGNF